MTAPQGTPRLDPVSPLFAEIRARYGAAFDAALARNVADTLAEDVGDGDRTGRLVPADSIRDARILVREEAVLCGVPWFVAVMQQVEKEHPEYFADLPRLRFFCLFLCCHVC